MKEVTVTVQFVIKTDVSDDTDLEAMERSIVGGELRFVTEEYVPSEDWAHVSVEPA